MTAVVSGDRAKAAGLTGVAGSLILAGAVLMMAVAAPSTPQPQHASTQNAGTQNAGTQNVGMKVATPAVTDPCHQLTSSSASASGRACLAGPSAVSAWADAYTPSMISESWSASRSARPPLTSAAVS
jgi:hypothetical protein